MTVVIGNTADIMVNILAQQILLLFMPMLPCGQTYSLECDSARQVLLAEPPLINVLTNSKVLHLLEPHRLGL